MAEAVMGPLLGRLQELVMKEAQAMAAVDDDARNLRDKLMWLQAFLRDAEPRRRARNDELTRVCLHQIRDAVFDAEDAVDRYLLKIDRYFLKIDLSGYPGWSQAILKFFTGFTTQVRVRSDLSRRFKTINTRLESIIENKDKYRIDQEGSSLTTWRPSTEVNAAIENLGRFALPLVGRDDMRGKVEKALTGETSSPMVITVSGESGVGKTKLVKEIYEQRWTKDHFKARAWVSFAPDLSTSQILKLILLYLELKAKSSKYDDRPGRVNLKAALKAKSSKDDDDGDLRVRLKAALKAKNYLLVLDGEVSSTEWKGILAVLPTSSVKSRVVRITHKDPKEAASDAGFQHTSFILDHFDKNASIDLFRRSLRKGNEKHNYERDDRQRKKYEGSIHDVTGGLPLSVVLLAGLLRTKEFPGQWKRVFDHLTDKSTESKRDDIILSMCFDDLPHDLKSCFLYFACFPVNMLVKARTMVCLWMAEGFLEGAHHGEGMTMEKLGNHYLSELAHRHLINVPPVGYTDPGFESVTVQTKVHDFLLREAREARFVEVHSGNDIPTLSTRRLSLQNHSNKYEALDAPLRKLRSIFSSFEKEGTAAVAAAAAAAAGRSSSGNNKGKNLSARVFPCLPSADANSQPDPKKIIQRLLQNSKFLRVISLDGLEIGIALPHEIGNVVHLQHLGITTCSLRVIPPSIGKLTRLQTLDVRGTKVTELPMEFWKIRTLRHVFGTIFLPSRVGSLEELQNLTVIKPDGDSYWDKKTFANMTCLNALHIEEISTNDVQAIYELKHLVILKLLSGEIIPLDLFTGSNLQRLQVMRLNGKIESPLSGRSFTLPTLTELVLQNTMVSQSFIDQLGKDLPLLSNLVLLEGSCETEQLVFKSGFHSIKYVTLEAELLRVEIQKPTFNNLVQMEIIVYSTDLCVNILDNPDIKNKIKLDNKYVRDTMTPPKVHQRVLQAAQKLMATGGGHRVHIHTEL